MIEVPILLVAYNRLDYASQVLNAIINAKPSILYFAVDGPKDERDALAVQEVRRLLAGVKGIKTVCWFDDINKGPDISVSQAVSKVLSCEEQVIVIEDDVMVSNSFLIFCEKMLIKYKDNDRIAMISGSNPLASTITQKYDYSFPLIGSTLSGWATWRRAWNRFTLKESFELDYQTLRERFISRNAVNFFKKQFRAFSRLPIGINTWDACWLFRRIANDQYSVVPSSNLTSNIGIRGTHFNEHSAFIHNLPIDRTFEIIHHPPEIDCDYNWDCLYYKEFLHAPLLRRIAQDIERKRIVNRIKHGYYSGKKI